MPIGGIEGVSIGRIDGGTNGQILAGQIGSMSSELSHIGILFPLTQLQTHAAFAGEKATCAAMPKVTVRAVKK